MITRRKQIQDTCQGQENEIAEENDYKVKLSVKIGERLIESDVEDALFIPTVDKLNPTVVANMMAEIPSVHARWNFLYNENEVD